MSASRPFAIEETCPPPEPATQEEEAEESAGQLEDIGDDPPDRASDNDAVRYCIQAWTRGYNRKRVELDEDAGDDPARIEAKERFLRVLPPLDSFTNVRDFIACITYAETIDVLHHWEVENFLDSAKMALLALRQEVRHHMGEPKPVGRPPRPHPPEENK